jgi:hypothetical protein
MDSHREVWRHLDKQASEDQALNVRAVFLSLMVWTHISFQSAREFSAVNLGHELALALKAANDGSDPFCCALRSAIQTLWTRCDGDVFDTRYDSILLKGGWILKHTAPALKKTRTG